MDMTIDQEATFQQAYRLAEDIIQLGRDEMAQVIGDWLAELRVNAAEDDEATAHYIDGVEDALLTLIQHGAADPLPQEVRS